MVNTGISKKCFKINNVDYYLKLIPTKCFYKKTSSFFTQSSMALFGPYHFKKIEGIVQCYKKMWGPLHLKYVKKWEKIGKFSKEWHNPIGQPPFYSMLIDLKERPKKKILIEVIYDDIKRVKLKNLLIEKVGRKNKYSPLEEIK